MAERISFSCSDCRVRFSASPTFAGHSCSCPRCGAAVVVPSSSPEPRPVLRLVDPRSRLTLRRMRAQAPVILRRAR
jgi:hypothetical protein